MAITRDDVLKVLSTVTVDAAGTTLPASGRLSQVVVDPTNRVMFSILIDPSEAERFEPIRRRAEVDGPRTGSGRAYGRRRDRAR